MAKKQPVIWASIKVFVKLFQVLPHKAACGLGSFLGGLVALLTPKKVREAEARCVKYLGASKKEARSIIFGSYRHFGRAVAEFARQPVNCKDINRFVRPHGAENLAEAYAAGKGVILFTAHIGNWEYAAVWGAGQGYELNAFGAEQRDDRITRLIEGLRSACGVKVLDKSKDMKRMIAALKAGEIIAIPIDQDAREDGVLSRFLNFPASTPTGIAKLAARFGSKVLPAFCVRSGDGLPYDLYIHPALEGKDGKPFGEDVQASMDACNELISDYIRRYPSQWLWMYPRWESVERGEIRT